ncbi:hypothetical protein B0H16DRAFT_1733708 [Mycena metata]|uniref:Uncharacterized protein n=1 Tax=Mycena metata TaxID=1033252 RepID=A0AAD7HYG6_9AGAR|nr:hypothetical protein B0H16DRAFT_1733708 [Mycena metata]
MSCGRLLTGEALKAPQDFCARFKLTRIRTLQKYFGLTMGFPPCPSVISRVKSRCGRRIGSGTGISAVICTTLIIRQFDSDTQHARSGPWTTMCESGPDLSSARGQRPATGRISRSLRPSDSTQVVAGRSRGRDSPLPRQDLRLSSSAQFCLDPGRNPPVLTSARPVDWRLGESLARSGRGPPLLTSDPWTIGDRDSLAEAFHLDPGSNLSLAPCSHSSVAPSPTPCGLDVRPSHGTAPTPPHSPCRLHTAIPHPQPSPARIRGPWWVFLVPPVPYPSPMMCAAIRLHHPFRKHALHSLATSTSLMSPVLDPFLARCATATAYPRARSNSYSDNILPPAPESALRVWSLRVACRNRRPLACNLRPGSSGASHLLRLPHLPFPFHIALPQRVHVHRGPVSDSLSSLFFPHLFFQIPESPSPPDEVHNDQFSTLRALTLFVSVDRNSTSDPAPQAQTTQQHQVPKAPLSPTVSYCSSTEILSIDTAPQNVEEMRHKLDDKAAQIEQAEGEIRFLRAKARPLAQLDYIQEETTKVGAAILFGRSQCIEESDRGLPVMYIGGPRLSLPRSHMLSPTDLLIMPSCIPISTTLSIN